MPGDEIELKGKTAWVALGALAVLIGVVTWNPWSDVHSVKAYISFRQEVLADYIISKPDELENGEVALGDIEAQIHRIQKHILPQLGGDVIYRVDFTIKAGEAILQQGQRDYRYE